MLMQDVDGSHYGARYSRFCPLFVREEFATSSVDLVSDENILYHENLVIDRRGGLRETELMRLLREVVPKLKMEVCTHVLARNNVTRKPLRPLYADPYKVIDRHHAFSLNVSDKAQESVIRTLKPFFWEAEYTGMKRKYHVG